LIHDEDKTVRWAAAESLGSAFVHASDKDSACKYLRQLTGDENSCVRRSAAEAIGFAFTHISDKYTAWQDLLLLTRDEDRSVRIRAVEAMSLILYQIPDQIPDNVSIWKELTHLAQDEDSTIQLLAFRAFGFAFRYAPKKDFAWKYLRQLSFNENSCVRRNAAEAIGFAFPYIPDKYAAWQVLIYLAGNFVWDVRMRAIDSLGVAFPHAPDKEKAWQDLIQLAIKAERDVRVSAYRSLGRASIYKATEAETEDDFRRELEYAIKYFERSASESHYSNPAVFCVPFYRSYYALTCTRDSSSEIEVKKHLEEAKRVSEGSKSRVELLEAVENLASALKEAQRLSNMKLDDIKLDLKAYMQYCNRAAELLYNTEKSAPGATKLVRRGLPIIDRRIKERIAEIQNKSRTICQQTRGTETPFEPLGFELNREAEGLSDRDYLKSARTCLRMAKIMREHCRLLPKDKRGLACEAIDEISEDNELEDNLSKLEKALIYILLSIDLGIKDESIAQLNNNLVGIELKVEELSRKISDRFDQVLSRLDQNEQNIIGSVVNDLFSKLDKVEKKTVQSVIKKIEDGRVPESEIKEVLDVVHQVLSEIQQHNILLNDNLTSENIDLFSKVVDETKLKVADQLILKVPIIPYVLSYQHQIQLESGVRLKDVWMGLKSFVKIKD
jgi:hypothetical protein